MELALRRGIAFFFDCALLFMVLWPLGLLVQKLLGVELDGGLQVWYALLINFSIPVWIYFTAMDASRRGATIGKRWQNLSVVGAESGEGISVGRAFARTALKLAPWEMIHLSAFALSADMGEFSVRQTIGITVANGLFIGYAVATIVTQGARSVHDFVVGTMVQSRVG